MSASGAGDDDDDTIRGAIIPMSSDVAPRAGSAGEAERVSGPEWTGFQSFPPEEGSGERVPSQLPLPSLGHFARRMLDIPRAVDTATHDEAVVHAVIGVLSDLFPLRSFCVRLAELVGPDGSRDPSLSLFYATGPLIDDREQGGQLRVTAAALEAAGVDPERAQRAGWTVTERYMPLFSRGASGFEVALVGSGELLGALSVEYPPEITPVSEDFPIVTALAVDLASRLRGARLLRESNWLRDYLARVIERANAPIVVLDASGHMTQANQAFADALGVTPDALSGRLFSELLRPSDRRHAAHALRAAREGQMLEDVELRVSAPESTEAERRIGWSVAPLAGRDGAYSGIVAIGRDRTAERSLEDQIRQAEKLATLGQLAAGVVHEINNPLTSISVYAEYLLDKAKRGGGDAGDVERLSRIGESAARIQRFTHDLVTYARPSTEEPTDVALPTVVDQALVFCDHVVSEAGVRVERDYQEGVPDVRGVRSQLHQVFINLVTNACHAMASAPAQTERVLSIRVYRREDEVVVELSDRGVGIRRAHLERIFEPFFSTKGEGRGTGLGLSIVRNIVGTHGGSIVAASAAADDDVESGVIDTSSIMPPSPCAPGDAAGETGTTFTIAFPVPEL